VFGVVAALEHRVSVSRRIAHLEGGRSKLLQGPTLLDQALDLQEAIPGGPHGPAELYNPRGAGSLRADVVEPARPDCRVHGGRLRRRVARVDPEPTSIRFHPLYQASLLRGCSAKVARSSADGSDRPFLPAQPPYGVAERRTGQLHHRQLPRESYGLFAVLGPFPLQPRISASRPRVRDAQDLPGEGAGAAFKGLGLATEPPTRQPRPRQPATGGFGRWTLTCVAMWVDAAGRRARRLRDLRRVEMHSVAGEWRGGPRFDQAGL